MEEWRSIYGYDGWYQVSNHGRIRSLVLNERCGVLHLVERRDMFVSRVPIAGRGVGWGIRPSLFNLM